MPGPSLAIRQECPLATCDNDGLMSATQACQLADLEIGTSSVLIYVNGTTGNDGAAGTAAAPLATLLAALQKTTPPWYKQRKIFIQDATVQTLPDGEYFLNGAAATQSSPLVIIGFPTDEFPADHAVQAGSTDTSILLAVVAAPNQFRGSFIQCLTGANAGQRRGCRQNSTVGPNEEFVPNTPFSNVPAPGDEYVIQNAGATIDIPIGDRVDIRSAAIGLKDVAVTGWILAVLSGGASMVTEGVQFKNLATFTLGGGIFLNSSQGTWKNDGPDNPFNNSLRGPAGASVSGAAFAPFGASFLISIDYGFLSGTIVVDTCQIQVNKATLELFNPDLLGSEILLENNSILLLGGVDGFPGRVDGTLSGGDSVIFRNSNAGGEDFGRGIRNLEISNSTNNAIALLQGSYANIALVTDGGGNAGFGIAIESMSKASVNFANTTVAGAGGDMLVGAVPRAYADGTYAESEIIPVSGAAASTDVGNTFTGLAGANLTDSDIGNFLITSGFATASNNFAFVIVTVLGPDSCEVAGVITSPDANDGAGSWTLKRKQPTLNRVESA